MLTLSLDTSTYAGSIAVQRNSEPIHFYLGDENTTHGQRLPGDVLKLLDGVNATLNEVERYVVSIGPGPFTALRVGIATVQGFAIANEKIIIPISTLDATAWINRLENNSEEKLLVLLDAHRGEVFANLYSSDGVKTIATPIVGRPEEVFKSWSHVLSGERLLVVGNGAHRAKEVLTQFCRNYRIPAEASTSIAEGMLTMLADGRHTPIQPHRLSPLYIRKPDAILARASRERNQR